MEAESEKTQYSSSNDSDDDSRKNGMSVVNVNMGDQKKVAQRDCKAKRVSTRG